MIHFCRVRIYSVHKQLVRFYILSNCKFMINIASDFVLFLSRLNSTSFFPARFKICDGVSLSLNWNLIDRRIVLFRRR